MLQMRYTGRPWSVYCCYCLLLFLLFFCLKIIVITLTCDCKLYTCSNMINKNWVDGDNNFHVPVFITCYSHRSFFCGKLKALLNCLVFCFQLIMPIILCLIIYQSFLYVGQITPCMEWETLDLVLLEAAYLHSLMKKCHSVAIVWFYWTTIMHFALCKAFRLWPTHDG